MHTCRSSDLDESIRILADAVKHTPYDSLDLPTRLINLGESLRDKYAATCNISFLREAFSKFENAQTALESILPTATVTYKFGIRIRGSNLDNLLVDSALLLRNMDSPDQRSRWGREMLTAVDGAKSRILSELLGRAGITAPAIIPKDLAAREESLIKEMVQIDRIESTLLDVQLEASGKGFSPETIRAKRRRGLIKELNEIWDYMETISYESAEFVALRRGRKLNWDDLRHLMDDLG